MNDDVYLTIDGSTEGYYKEKGSRFLAFAHPVKTESEVKEIVEKLKKEHHNARHHCYAYILGVDGSHHRANDAGEPNHSAGDPILGQIRSKGITNTLVVVTRYFGGTKLGIPGLMNAYKAASADALERANIVEKVVRESLEIIFDYSRINDIMRLVREHDVEIIHQKFTTDCRMTLGLRKSNSKDVKFKLDFLLKSPP
jgi:uncharacterized YigZ family protein